MRWWQQAVLSDDAVAALSEEVVLFVKLSLVLADGHVEALLLEVRLLLLADGGFFQHLHDTDFKFTTNTMARLTYRSRKSL